MFSYAKLVVVTFSLIMTLVCVALVSSRYLVPSSELIALTSNKNGNWDIYLMDIDHALLSNLTRNPSDDFVPTWSPHTEQFAFYSDQDGDGVTEIYQMNFDGSAVNRMIPKPGNHWRPQWSPDGQQVVFTRDFGNIFVADIEGQNEIWLGYGFSPIWSPTDSRIALYANNSGNAYADVYVIDADGQNRRNLTLHHADDWGPAWSPDGSQIAFLSSRDSDSEIYVMDSTCKAPCPVQRLTDNFMMELALAWSPDGSRIVFEAEVVGKSQIYMMNSNGSNLHRVVSSEDENRSPIFIR